SGTAFLGIFKTKRGLICHILKNTLGPKLLWALNSSAKDRALRDVLYEELGTKKAREELANRFLWEVHQVSLMKWWSIRVVSVILKKNHKLWR
ncbi:hypothetical protein ACXYTC_20020, partial [Escherichia coli]